MEIRHHHPGYFHTDLIYVRVKIPVVGYAFDKYLNSSLVDYETQKAYRFKNEPINAPSVSACERSTHFRA